MSDEREIGILIGKVEGVGEQIAELRRTNGEEHRHTAERFDKLEGLLTEKADAKAVTDHESRIDSLEGTRDRQSGGFAAGVKMGGYAAAAVLLVFGAYVTKVIA